MSFRQNSSQQMSFSNTLYGLTDREKKALEHSWAKVFADDVFPAINEKPLAVLYSDKASRPNAPVNVIIGAMILKELFDLSDDDVVENLMLDPRYQYALHTMDFEEQPLSDKSLSRFRIRCYDYEQTHGIDLYHDCIKDLSASIAKMMKISGKIRRMDSLMVEANIRKLSRMELIYTCIAKLVTYLHKNGKDDLIGHMAHYYEPDDFNRVIYHSKSTDADERMDVLLKDADILLERCGSSFDDVTEYQLFTRCLSDQTVAEDGKRRLKTKADDIGSGILQNPSDPDACYREKAGKVHRGYVANVEESVDENGSVVSDYQFDRNTKSDSAMLKEHLSGMEKQAEKTVIITDGAYSGEENRALAESRNVELVTTDLTGRDVDTVLGAFEFNEDGTKVLRCPAGHEPKSCSCNKQNGQCVISFDRSLCAACPFKEHCHPKIYKKVSRMVISKNTAARARLKAGMQTEEFRQYSRLRNGVETIPSILKNRYHVDRMPVRRKIRCKFFFGSKIGALNFKKLFRFRMNTGHYAQNPVLG
jgi:hypothetical protein